MISMYVDGSWSSVSGRGGIGVYGEVGGTTLRLSGPMPLRKDTTSQVSEMWAAIIGMELVEMIYPPKVSRKSVRIFSDSAYVVNCLKGRWYERWAERNRNNKKWQNSIHKDIKNLSFWIHLFSLVGQCRESKFWNSVDEDFMWLTSIRRPILTLPPAHRVELVKVAAHTGNKGNEEADKLANRGRDLPYPIMSTGDEQVKEWVRPEESRQVSIAGRGRASLYHSTLDLYSDRQT